MLQLPRLESALANGRGLLELINYQLEQGTNSLKDSAILPEITSEEQKRLCMIAY